MIQILVYDFAYRYYRSEIFLFILETEDFFPCFISTLLAKLAKIENLPKINQSIQHDFQASVPKEFSLRMGSLQLDTSTSTELLLNRNQNRQEDDQQLQSKLNCKLEIQERFMWPSGSLIYHPDWSYTRHGRSYPIVLFSILKTEKETGQGKCK